jgi:hypothetical protein
MKRCRADGFMAELRARRRRCRLRRSIETALKLLHIFVAADAVYQALTIFGKDCGQHRRKSIFRLTGGPKLTFVQAQTRDNAHNSRMESRHGFKGRTQAA